MDVDILEHGNIYSSIGRVWRCDGRADSISAAEDISEELGIELKPEDENIGSEMFRDLKMNESEHPTDPLFEGSWA